MKVKIDISCTPKEARAFFGLPDVTALNEAMTSEIGKRMAEGLAEASPEALLGQWMSLGGKMSEQFMGMMGAAMKDTGPGKP